MIFACTITPHRMSQRMHCYLKHLCRCLLLEWTHLKLSPGRWLSPSPTLKVIVWCSLLQQLISEPSRKDRISLTIQTQVYKWLMQFVNLGNIQQGLRAEFYITNYNTNEFLSPVVLETFADVVVQIFQHPEAHIIQVIQPSFRGIAVPPSPAKHGLVCGWMYMECNFACVYTV